MRVSALLRSGQLQTLQPSSCSCYTFPWRSHAQLVGVQSTDKQSPRRQYRALHSSFDDINIALTQGNVSFVLYLWPRPQSFYFKSCQRMPDLDLHYLLLKHFTQCHIFQILLLCFESGTTKHLKELIQEFMYASSPYTMLHFTQRTGQWGKHSENTLWRKQKQQLGTTVNQSILGQDAEP